MEDYGKEPGGDLSWQELKKPGLHDFRRAFCLSQLQVGVPKTTIARLMGHTTTQLIARYAKQTSNNLRQHFHSTVDDNTVR
jgi:integrase